ncbi:MAG: YkgJ family cysteine cluster protein [Kiritimatiellia bacterium]
MAAPLSFTCRQCGACCRWPGSVLLAPADVAAAAAALGLSEQDFIDRHAVLARNRAQLTLQEAPGGACEFLQADGRCRIYAARPRQCRDFPHGWQVAGCPGLARS